MAELLVVETAVLVEFTRGRPDATAFVGDLLVGGVAGLHPVSEAEMLHGAIDQRDMREIARE